jgi:transposase
LASNQKEELAVKETTRQVQYTTHQPELYMAFELGEAHWKLGFTVGLGQNPRRRTIGGRNLVALRHEIKLAKRRFHLPETAPVRSCYEAGREGFWLHRHLTAEGVANLVVDSASIEVSRRKKRPKTDRLDVGKLLTMQVRYHLGEDKVWSVLHVPSVEMEDSRQLHRELGTVKADRKRSINRIKGLLATQGIRLTVGRRFLKDLPQARLWDESPLPPGLQARLLREYTRLQFLQEQIKAVEAERLELLQREDDPVMEKVRQLMRLKGIGIESAWVLVMEFFGWRNLRNRREVGALAGLTPTPYASGDSAREQGISKAGNERVRALVVELAWGWLRHQPDSELSRWFEERFACGSKRTRKVGIVAVARRLLVALWRYLEYGQIPAGAQLKA